jgi:capsular exopolysaccharide synthesis family protein
MSMADGSSRALALPGPVSQRPPEPAGLGRLDPRRMWAIFLRRLPLFATVGGSVFALFLIVAMQAQKEYRSTVSVLIERPQNKVLDTNGYIPPPLDSNAIDTEVQILESRALAGRVVEKLNLAADPEFNGADGNKNAIRHFLANPFAALRAAEPEREPPPVREPGTTGPPQAIVEALAGHTLVRRSGLTYVINVTVSSTDPVKAAKLANAYGDAYVASRLDAKYEASHTANNWLGDRLVGLRADVERAETALQQYKISHNLMSAEGGTMAEQEVSVLNRQIADANVDLSEKQAKLATARAQIDRGGGGADTSAALGSNTVQALRAQEAEGSRQLAELTVKYGDRYPDVQKVRSQLAATRTQIQQEIDRAMSSLQADVEVSRQRLNSLRNSQNAARGSLAQNSAAQVGQSELQRKVDASKAVYEAFLSRSKETSAEEGLQQADARVVAPALVSGVPASPNVQLAALFGIAVGLIAGFLAIGAAEMLNSGIETGSQVEERFGIRYAGAVPQLKSSVKRKFKGARPHEYMIDHPFSIFAESFRSIRAFLMLPGADAPPPKVIAITSAMPQEGKSMTAFCLARTMAASGSEVVLIDCDVRRRGASQYVTHRDVGIVEVLQGQAEVVDALVRDERSGAWVLPALAAPNTPRDLFATEAMDRLLVTLRRHFEFVIIDTAPVLAVADTRVVASKADAVLMLTRWRRTAFHAADTALDLLIETGSNVVGMGLTQVDLRKQSLYGYGDRYYYFKGYASYYSE